MQCDLDEIYLDKIYVNIVADLARKSTCYKKKTAAIIVKDKKILSCGYNGVVEGATRCDQVRIPLEQHYKWSIANEIHGEMNAILDSAKRGGTPLEGAVMYTLLSPCIHCAKSIQVAGIKRVVYVQKYERDPGGIEFLLLHGIKVDNTAQPDCQIFLD